MRSPPMAACLLPLCRRSCWSRDPLLALGCCDPVERIDRVKADDPQRRQIVELFEAWNACHGERPIKAADLAVPVRALVDPRGRGRHHVEVRLMQLVGTCVAGFTLTKQDAADGRGAYVFALRSTFGEGSESSAVYCGPVLRHPAELMLPAVDLCGRVWPGGKPCKDRPVGPTLGG
jgi:hypothetical protein